MKFVFLMDPLSSVSFEKDTTFVLMLAAHKRYHEVYYLSNGATSLIDGEVTFHVKKVIPKLDKNNPFVIESELTLNANQIDALFIRTDPPFDSSYLLNTWLFDQLPKSVFVMNDPNAIRSCNEKIWAAQFKSIVPKTIVSSMKKDLLKFIDTEKKVIAKPTNSYGGQNIFAIKNDDINKNVILETLTDNFSKEIILQQFIKDADIGDKRILLLNGEILGAVLRVHKDGEHRNNFFSGGKPMAAEITDRDKEIVEILKPRLLELGLYFVGIDIIGEYLIEVNVTSPTCLQEMNRLYDKHLEDDVVAFVEKRVNT